MASGVVHIIGGGLAGLASAVALRRGGVGVVVHEAARFAGGRCRSYFEPSLGISIDNGNHLVLSGNRAALDYLATIGAASCTTTPTPLRRRATALASPASPAPMICTTPLAMRRRSPQAVAEHGPQ